ncbi:hypothetical protein BE15_40910 [Sorangium cellulosum]|uniref:Uncharacterized protein n=1 Tax=Sorangium cellulosum TaxID=56 RepID=A0A150QVG3_SORCE|nr:hypothetical protein BE15_40910 [Sorangium cellulosum]
MFVLARAWQFDVLANPRRALRSSAASSVGHLGRASWAGILGGHLGQEQLTASARTLCAVDVPGTAWRPRTAARLDEAFPRGRRRDTTAP